jgi:uncharacterized membrane protein HdeD (DUF308 family)
MADTSSRFRNSTSETNWLKAYYFARAAVSIVWVAAAFTVGKNVPVVGYSLLVAYPAWDAIANIADVQGNGGWKKNPTQVLNAAVSGATTLAVAIALGISMNAVLGVYGVWAALSGLFQLATGVRRWKSYGAQWAMILSGAQSVLAGAFFLKQASLSQSPGISDIAPYAAFGAFYFLVSALWLVVSDARRRRAQPAGAQ